MTDYTLSKYLRVRLDTSDGLKGSKNKYIITLSRDFGCDGDEIADLIIEELNKKKSPVKRPSNWKLVSKQILKESAEELKIHPGKLEQLMAKNQGFFDEILQSFSDDQYPNDIKIRRTIKDVIQSAANEGNVLILGRGGEAITSQRPNSLHIKVTAPIEWRVNHLVKSRDLTKEKARKLIQEIDREREDLKQFFLGNKKDEIMYHAIFNRQLMSIEEIAEAIVNLLQLKSKGKGI